MNCLRLCMSKRSARIVDVAMDNDVQTKDSHQFAHSRLAAEISDDNTKGSHTCRMGT